LSSNVAAVTHSNAYCAEEVVSSFSTVAGFAFGSGFFVSHFLLDSLFDLARVMAYTCAPLL
jgi:hypothetical protein